MFLYKIKGYNLSMKKSIHPWIPWRRNHERALFYRISGYGEREFKSSVIGRLSSFSLESRIGPGLR
jgi:hypothetical protein